MTIYRKVFDEYEKKFNQPLNGPDLSFGHNSSVTLEMIAAAGVKAIQDNKPIDWSEYYTRLTEDEDN